MIDRIADWLNLTHTQSQLVLTAVWLVGLVVIRAAVLAIVKRRIEDTGVWYRTRKFLSYAIGLIGAIVVVTLWVEGSGIPTYIGFLTAGLAIALSDVLKNLAGWLYIVVRRPFRLGERIEVRGHKGDVVDIRAFRFTLFEIGTDRVDAEQPTGRLLHMPNGTLFTEPVANYTEGFRYLWLEIPVLVTFESNWEEAEQILSRVIEEVAPDRSEVAAGLELRKSADHYRIGITMLDPVVFVTVRDSGILLTARVVAAVGRTRQMEQEIWKGFLRAIADRPDIELAYHTIRTHLRGPIELQDRGEK
ncbi:MAG: mechanosensitive ion channel domain-containing protein [Acidimicrobiia bacterium]